MCVACKSHLQEGKKSERKAFSRTYLFAGATLCHFFLRGVENKGEKEFRGMHYHGPAPWPCRRRSRDCGSPCHTGSWQPGFSGHLWVRTASWATWQTVFQADLPLLQLFSVPFFSTTVHISTHEHNYLSWGYAGWWKSGFLRYFCFCNALRFAYT